MRNVNTSKRIPDGYFVQEERERGTGERKEETGGEGERLKWKERRRIGKRGGAEVNAGKEGDY